MFIEVPTFLSYKYNNIILNKKLTGKKAKKNTLYTAIENVF